MNKLSLEDKHQVFGSSSVKKFKKSMNMMTEKHSNFFRNLNRVGMSSLVVSSIVNHGINTIFKGIDAYKGNDLNFYDEKSKTYLKPYFSIPTKWHESKISFGTPWYY